LLGQRLVCGAKHRFGAPWFCNLCQLNSAGHKPTNTEEIICVSNQENAASHQDLRSESKATFEAGTNLCTGKQLIILCTEGKNSNNKKDDEQAGKPLRNTHPPFCEFSDWKTEDELLEQILFKIQIGHKKKKKKKKLKDELPRQLRTNGGEPSGFSKHPGEHAQKSLLWSTTASKPTAALPWLSCTSVSAARAGFAQPSRPTHPASASPPGANTADNEPRSHGNRFLSLPTLSSGFPSKQEVPSAPEVAALYPKTHPIGAWQPQDIQQPRHLDMWQLSRAVQ